MGNPTLVEPGGGVSEGVKAVAVSRPRASYRNAATSSWRASGAEKVTLQVAKYRSVDSAT